MQQKRVLCEWLLTLNGQLFTLNFWRLLVDPQGGDTGRKRHNSNGLCTLTSASKRGVRGNRNSILKEWDNIFIPYTFRREKAQTLYKDENL